MKYHINKLGDLEISVTFDERNRIKADKDNDDFLSVNKTREIFEPLMCNSDLEWIAPEDIGALTAAPILGITDTDDYGKLVSVEKVWWYPNYCIRSPQEDLVEYGVCVFQKAD